MLVHDSEIEEKGGEENAWEKKQRAGKLRSGGQRRGQRVEDPRPNVFMLDAKGLWLKVYGPQANRPKARSQRPTDGEVAREAAG